MKEFVGFFISAELRVGEWSLLPSNAELRWIFAGQKSSFNTNYIIT